MKINVQPGLEHLTGSFKKPDDPWLDMVTWATVLAAPKFVVHEAEIAGLAPHAVYHRMQLLREGETTTDAYAWTGEIPGGYPGFTLHHCLGRWAWLQVLGS